MPSKDEILSVDLEAFFKSFHPPLLGDFEADSPILKMNAEDGRNLQVVESIVGLQRQPSKTLALDFIESARLKKNQQNTFLQKKMPSAVKQPNNFSFAAYRIETDEGKTVYGSLITFPEIKKLPTLLFM